MTLGSEVSKHLGQPVAERIGDLGTSLSIPGVSLFIRPNQPVCAESCANSLRIMQEKRTYRDHLTETLKEELPADLKCLLDQLK